MSILPVRSKTASNATALRVGAALLTGLLLGAGCHNPVDDATLPAVPNLKATLDTPTSLPAAAALFAAVMAPAPSPAEQVAHAPVPLRPPDPGEVAQ